MRHFAKFKLWAKTFLRKYKYLQKIYRLHKISIKLFLYMNIGMYLYSTFRQCNTYRVWRNLAVHKAHDFSLLFTPVDDATDDNNVIDWCGVAYQRIKNIVGH